MSRSDLPVHCNALVPCDVQKPIVPELAAEAPAKPTETATKIDIIEKAADDIRADHDNVYKQSENEEDVGARMMEETAAEKVRMSHHLWCHHTFLVGLL